MALRFKLQFVVVADADEQVSVDEIVLLHKDHQRLEHVGLTSGQ
jgi:hypothetical protein